VPPPVVWPGIEDRGGKVTSSFHSIVFLPVSSEFLEKASYGDPLFRMAPERTGARIPITADREYLMEALAWTGDVCECLRCKGPCGVRAKSIGQVVRPTHVVTEEELSYLYLNELEAATLLEGRSV
jgi:hypothetical protein